MSRLPPGQTLPPSSHRWHHIFGRAHQNLNDRHTRWIPTHTHRSVVSVWHVSMYLRLRHLLVWNTLTCEESEMVSDFFFWFVNLHIVKFSWIAAPVLFLNLCVCVCTFLIYDDGVITQSMLPDQCFKGSQHSSCDIHSSTWGRHRDTGWSIYWIKKNTCLTMFIPQFLHHHKTNVKLHRTPALEHSRWRSWGLWF